MVSSEGPRTLGLVFRRTVDLQTRREVQVLFTGYPVCVKNFMSLLEIIMVGEISE